MNVKIALFVSIFLFSSFILTRHLNSDEENVTKINNTTMNQNTILEVDSENRIEPDIRLDENKNIENGDLESFFSQEVESTKIIPEPEKEKLEISEIEESKFSLDLVEIRDKAIGDQVQVIIQGMHVKGTLSEREKSKRGELFTISMENGNYIYLNVGRVSSNGRMYKNNNSYWIKADKNGVGQIISNEIYHNEKGITPDFYIH